MSRPTTPVVGALVVLVLAGSVGTIGAAHVSHDTTVPTCTETKPTLASSASAVDMEQAPVSVVDESSTVSAAVALDADSLSLGVDDVQNELTTLPDEFSPFVVLPPVAYSRYDNSDPLTHETRQDIYETVAARPGTYISEVASVTETPVSTVRYHVRILLSEGLIETDRIRGKNRLFPRDSGSTEVQAALNDESTAPILRAIRQEEPVAVSNLADAVDLATSTVSYHLGRLEEAELIERDRDGMAVSVSLTEPVRQEIAG